MMAIKVNGVYKTITRIVFEDGLTLGGDYDPTPTPIPTPAPVEVKADTPTPPAPKKRATRKKKTDPTPPAPTPVPVAVEPTPAPKKRGGGRKKKTDATPAPAPTPVPVEVKAAPPVNNSEPWLYSDVPLSECVGVATYWTKAQPGKPSKEKKVAILSTFNKRFGRESHTQCVLLSFLTDSDGNGGRKPRMLNVDGTMVQACGSKNRWVVGLCYLTNVVWF